MGGVGGRDGKKASWGAKDQPLTASKCENCGHAYSWPEFKMVKVSDKLTVLRPACPRCGTEQVKYRRQENSG